MLIILILTSLVLIPIQEAAVHPYSDFRGYDRSINVFNPDGELMQTRYAEEAASKGDTIVCVTSSSQLDLSMASTAASSRIVLGISTKAEDKFLDRSGSGIDKVSKVDDNIWVACTGLAGDGRALLRITRMVCANYRTRYGCPPTMQYLAGAIGEMQHEFTLSGKERPYGVSLMFIGFDEDSLTPQVLVSKVDGSVSRWSAVSVGKQSSSCMEYLTGELTEEGNDVGSHREHHVPSFEKAAKVVMESFNLPALRRASDDQEEEGGHEEVDDNTYISESPCDIYVFKRDSLDVPATLQVFLRVRDVVEVLGDERD